MSKPLEQLALSIDLRDDCTLETFYPGDNQQVCNHLQQFALGTQGIQEQFIYLWGREGVGRTHLLQGACHRAARHGIRAVYLSLSDSSATPDILEGLERVELVCLDDLDAICTHKKWEEAIFHLFNRLRALNHRLLVAANAPAKQLAIQLPDLQSRLTWGVAYQIHPLNDDQLLAALQLRAKERGLELPKEVGLFLIRRCARAMPILYELLERLDKASLAAQRRLTIPFVKSVLDL